MQMPAALLTIFPKCPTNFRNVYIHVYIYTYVQIYIYTYIHIYIYTYTHIYICTYTHIRIYTYTYVHISAATLLLCYIHTHIHIYIKAYIHRYIHTCIFTYKLIWFDMGIEPSCPKQQCMYTSENNSDSTRRPPWFGEPYCNDVTAFLGAPLGTKFLTRAY